MLQNPLSYAPPSRDYDRDLAAKEKAMTVRCAAKILLAFMLIGHAAAAEEQPLRRTTVWDIKLGAHVSAQPAPDEFKILACGSNGGPPRQQLVGWGEFGRCRAEPNGLHEVYFEYD